MADEKIAELKVRADADVKSLGSSVAHNVVEGKQVYLRALGAGAVNQAVKSVAIANEWLASRGRRIALVPGFIDVPAREGTGKISGIVLRAVEV